MYPFNNFIYPLNFNLIMKKRSIGHRADPLIDSIDLMILRILKEEDSLSVLELARVTNLPHKNLKPHLEKLIQAKIVYAFKSKDSQKIDLVYYTHPNILPPVEKRDFLDIIGLIAKNKYPKKKLK